VNVTGIYITENEKQIKKNGRPYDTGLTFDQSVKNIDSNKIDTIRDFLGKPYTEEGLDQLIFTINKSISSEEKESTYQVVIPEQKVVNGVLQLLIVPEF
jgi:hypothetical protein